MAYGTHATCSSSNLIYHLTCIQCDSFYVGETKNSLSTRMSGHRSSSINPNNLPLLVAIHNKSHQLPFNSCWNVRVLHNLPPNTIAISTTILNLPINLLCSLDTALVLTSFNFHLFSLHLCTSPPFVSRNPSGGPFRKLSCGAIFNVCSHTFTFF